MSLNPYFGSLVLSSLFNQVCAIGQPLTVVIDPCTQRNGKAPLPDCVAVNDMDSTDQDILQISACDSRTLSVNLATLPFREWCFDLE